MDWDKRYGLDQPEPKKQEIQLPDLPDTSDIRERAKAVEKDIFATYYKLMMADSTPPAIKKSCADALADRARGKPVQGVEVAARVTHETLIIQRTPIKQETLPVIDVKVVE